MYANSLFVFFCAYAQPSNLNRQFLFRDTDLNQSKSHTAARAAKTMNPDLTVRVTYMLWPYLTFLPIPSRKFAWLHILGCLASRSLTSSDWRS